MKKKEQDDTSLNGVELHPDATASRGAGATEKAIIALLDTAKEPLSPKAIALELKLKHNTIKSSLRRLAQKHILQCDASGYYFLPRKNIMQDLEKDLLFNGQKGSLPKAHDIQILFKPVNYRKALSQYPETGKFFNGFKYELEGGVGGMEPAQSWVQQPLIPRCPNTSSLPLPLLTSDSPSDSFSQEHYLNRFFNPMDPASLYQLWDRKKAQTIDGGFQEVFKMPEYRLTVQFYGTGTIKLTIHNTEHPFDAIQFREFLSMLDGIFIGRTGISFKDIGIFFYVDQVHFNSDVLGDRQYQGMSKMNLTCQVMDDFLMRIYEKVLGKDLYIRQEYCQTKGNIEDHNLNSMLALLMGGVNPAITTAQIFKTSKDQGQIVDVVKALQGQMRAQMKFQEAQGKQIEALAQMIRGMAAPPCPPPVTTSPSPPVTDAPSNARKAHSSAPRLEDYLGQVRCPRCKRAMQQTPQGYVCPGCGSGVSA